jgi:xanthine dehydrogenase YagS FAD-binding subunit
MTAMNRFAYLSATTLEQAARRAGRQGSQVKAGGVDVVDLCKEGLVAPDLVVSLLRIPGLGAIEEKPDGSVSIGALCTLHQIAQSPLLRERFPALAAAAAGAATPQIRRVATLGGNLHQRPRCWYFRSPDFQCLKKGGAQCFAQEGDNRFHAIFGNRTCAIVHPSATAVPLVAYGASLLLRGEKEERRVPIEEHFVGPDEDVRREHRLKAGELLAQVVLPAGARRSAYLKFKERQSFDWPLADVAVSLKMSGGTCEEARVVLGAAAPVPWRARAAESLLSGKRIDAAVAEAAGVAAVKGATPLAENGYKVQLFRVLTRRAILQAMEARP